MNFVQAICNEVVVEPKKALRKLPRVQHLCAQLSGKLPTEDHEVISKYNMLADMYIHTYDMLD